MKIHKQAFNAFIFLTFLSGISLAAPLYPTVSQLVGDVYMKNKDAGEIKLKKGFVLKDKGVIQTEKNAQVRVELDPESFIIVAENSKVELPGYIQAEGAVYQIDLEEGALRVRSKGPVERIFTTPITKDIYREVEFILKYDPKRAVASMTVLNGGLVFRGMEHEEEVQMVTGTRAEFIGMLEGAEPVYDILLKGRRVARGKLAAVEHLSPEELAKVDRATLLKKPEKAKPKKAVRLASQICDYPLGELNQCSWVCENNPKKAKKCEVTRSGVKCVRRRCTANGEWKDPLVDVSPQQKCGTRPFVGSCDY